jgi:hypothetical protein
MKEEGDHESRLWPDRADDLLLDRLEDALPVLVLVVLWMELGPGELTDETLGERPLLIADLRLGAAVDLGRILGLGGKVEPLKEQFVLVHPDRDSEHLAAVESV